MSRTPTLAEVLTESMRVAMRGVFTALVGSIESYDRATGLASVQPLILDSYVDETGERVPERFPIVQRVPVVFPSAGEFSLTFPVTHGATGLLVFSTRSIDRWVAVGGEVDPNDDRRQALSDAVFFLGVRPVPQALPESATDTDAMVLASPSLIKLGSSAASEAPATKADLDALKQAITDTVVVAMDGGASFKSTLLTELASWPSPAGKVRIE